ncbi:MAG: neutral/alkaline non-lysosomal ceramidase N-terminal domain-containing protein [Gemmataceae bacterium]|nr:neutral/alkaline non-lysosomal ceramidase N-terminal domain-containing protein [Gemmataceae bacterium]
MRWLGVLFVVSSLHPAFLNAQEATWKAGVAKTIITPTKPMWMSGYGGRTKPAQGKETELWAKALVLEDAKGHTAVLVTLDLVGIGRDISAPVCKRLQDKHGLDRAAIILSCSHTHCGPVVGDNLRAMYFLDAEQGRLVDEYTAMLRAKIDEVVGAAMAERRPAVLSWTIGTSGFAVNRRTNKEAKAPELIERGLLQGPVDHDVPVLAVRDHDGKLRAVAFGYACHATVMDYLKWSGDYPGFAQMELEKSHPGAVALFWAGCGGDQNPLPRRQVELARKYGKQLAQSVDAVLAAKMQPVAGAWIGAYREIDLTYHEVPSRDKLVQDTLSDNKYVANRARHLLKELEAKGSLRGTYPYPVQVWRLGDEITWVALGGEVVVDYALRLKRELTPGKTWVMAYANDVMAYIPSLRVLKEGGYEGGGAMIYYGLPSIWGPRVEELIVENVKQIVKQSGAR